MGISDEGSSNGEGNSKDWRWIGDGEAVWFISSIVNYLIGVHPFYPLKYLMRPRLAFLYQEAMRIRDYKDINF